MSLRAKQPDPSYLRVETYPVPIKSPLENWGRFFTLVIVIVWLAGLVIGFQMALTILTVMGFLAAIVGLRSPSLGLLGIGMLCTLDAVMRNYLMSGGFLRWNTLNYWLLLVMVLFVPFLLRLNNPTVRLLQVFIILLTLELAISPDVSQGVLDVLNIVTSFGLLIYFARAHHESSALYWLAIVSGMIGALGGLVYFLQIDTLAFMNPNAWAFFPLTGLLMICLGYSFQGAFPRNRLLLLALAAVNGIWIFFSGSRGTILTGVIAFLFLFLASRNLSWKAVMLFMVALAGIWFSARFVEQSSYTLSRLNSSLDPNRTLTQRTSKRSDIMLAGLEVFSKNPFGIGTGGFEETIDRLRDIVDTGRPAHSAWIKVLAENGVPGFLLLFLYLLSFTIAGWKRRVDGMFLLGLLVTLSIGVSFITKEYQGKGLWLLASGVTSLLYAQDIQNALNGTTARIRTLRQVKRIVRERRRYGQQ